MKKFILLILLVAAATFESLAGFIIHTYFINQSPPDCYNMFVVVTYDNNDGQGEIYVSSGTVQVGSGCPQKVINSDESSVIDLEQLMSTPEVNGAFQTYLASKGIDGSDLEVGYSVSVFCNPQAGFVIVSRYANAVDNVKILNQQGNVLKSFIADPNQKTERYDISDLNPGVYIVAVGKEQITIHTGQVLKE